MNLKLSFLVLCLVAALSGQAKATTIDYIFTGTGSGTLGSTSFDGNYTFTFVGNTTGVFYNGGTSFVNDTVGTFSTSSLNASLGSTGVGTVLIGGTPTVDFSQINGFRVFNSALSGYELTTTFPLISGSVLTIGSPTFTTNEGILTLGPVSTLSFEAIEPSATPLPDAFLMFIAALGCLGLIGHYMRRRRAI